MVILYIVYMQNSLQHRSTRYVN